MAKTQQRRLKSLRAVEHYLQGKGWNASSNIYRHAKQGYIKQHKNGGYTKRAAVVYANNYLQKLSKKEAEGKKPIPRKILPDELTLAKREAEAKKLAAQARLYERKADIQEREWVKADLFEKALAERAARFKSDIENLIRSKCSESCHIVEGNDIKIPELIVFWLENFEALLGRYAN